MNAIHLYYFLNELNFDDKLKEQVVRVKCDNEIFEVESFDWDSKEVVLVVKRIKESVVLK